MEIPNSTFQKVKSGFIIFLQMKIPSSTFQKVKPGFIKTDKAKSVFIKSMISHNPICTKEPGQTEKGQCILHGVSSGRIL